MSSRLKLFSLFLVINLVFEGLVGLLLIFNPEQLVEADQEHGIIWARNYGFAALAIASIGLWLFKHRRKRDAVVVAVSTLVTFHTGLAIGTGMAISLGSPLFPVIAHGLLAVAFAGFLATVDSFTDS